MEEIIKNQLIHLNQCSKEVISIYQRAAFKAGISGNEFWILYGLFIFEDNFSQQERGDLWSLPKQTVNSIITNLIKKNIVYLENIKGTRNKKNIFLTESGKEFVKQTILPIYEAEQRALAKIDENDRQLYIVLSEKYLANMREEIEKL